MSTFDVTDAKTRDEILQVVEKICASADFARSDRLKRFLRFIVSETLAGEAPRLKAYSIALAVFDRPDSFDPQVDPLVRIEAGRLRRSLERYSMTEGLADPIVIQVPKGAYVPCFKPGPGCPGAALPETVGETAPVAAAAGVIAHVPGSSDRSGGFAAEAPEEVRSRPGPTVEDLPTPQVSYRRMAAAAAVLVAVAGVFLHVARRPTPAAVDQKSPVLAVMPFSSTPGDLRASQLAQGLSDELIDQLSQNGELRILGRETTRKIPEGDAASHWARYSVRYVVEGSVYSGTGAGSVSARLVDTGNGQVIWSARYPVASGDDLARLQGEVGAAIAGTIAKPYGIVFRLEALRMQPAVPPEWANYACTLRYHAYRKDLSMERLPEARDCLSQVVRAHPDFAPAWAMLAQMHLDTLRAGVSERDRADILERARRAAATAFDLAPENVRAQQSLMLVRFFAGDIKGGIELGRRAMALSPHNPDLLGEFGARLAQAGRWEEGRELLLRALELNPGNEGVYFGHLAFIDLVTGRYASAEAWIERSALHNWPLHDFVRALIKTELGKFAEAGEAMTRFRRSRPDFVANLETELSARNLQEADRVKIRAAVARLTVQLSQR